MLFLATRPCAANMCHGGGGGIVTGYRSKTSLNRSWGWRTKKILNNMALRSLMPKQSARCFVLQTRGNNLFRVSGGGWTWKMIIAPWIQRIPKACGGCLKRFMKKYSYTKDINLCTSARGAKPRSRILR